MRKILVIVSLAICLFVYLRCNNDTVTNSSGNTIQTEDPSITSISGTITGWTFGTGYTIKLQLGTAGTPLGTSPIGNDGSFNITPLSVPPGNTMTNIYNLYYQQSQVCTGNFTVSNHNANFTSSYGLLFAYKPDNTFFGDVIYGSSEYERVYAYADTNVNVTANFSCVQGSQTTTHTHNYLIKTGWNKLTTSKLAATTSNYTVNNTVISGATWFIIHP